MAVSEEDDGSQPPTTDSNQAGAEASSDDSGPRDGRHPIASSDYFLREYLQKMYLSNLNVLAVLASFGDRVTSVTGSPSLDLISRVAAMRTSRLDSWPQRDARSDDTAAVHSTSNLAVCNGSAVAAEASETVSVNSFRSISNLSSAPSLSMDSLISGESESDPTMESNKPCKENEPEPEELSSRPKSQVKCQVNQKCSEGSDLSECSGVEKSTESVVHKTVKSMNDPSVPKQHFGENETILKPQPGSSGYESFGTGTQVSKGNVKHMQRQGSAICKTADRDFNRSVNDSALQISETGINAIKCAAGTQTSPVFPKYSSFPSRLTSFPREFCLGDGVKVNRDLLAIAGFFYSGSDTVTCYHCGCNPRVWGDGRDPKTEHCMLAPYCKAIVHH